MKDPDDYERSRDDLSFFKNKRYYKIYETNCEKLFQNIEQAYIENHQSFGYQTMYDILTGNYRKKTKLNKSISTTSISSVHSSYRDNYIISIINN